MVFLNTKLNTGISFIVVYLTAIATPVVQGLPATEARTDHPVCAYDEVNHCCDTYTDFFRWTGRCKGLYDLNYSDLF